MPEPQPAHSNRSDPSAIDASGTVPSPSCPANNAECAGRRMADRLGRCDTPQKTSARSAFARTVDPQYLARLPAPTGSMSFHGSAPSAASISETRCVAVQSHGNRTLGSSIIAATIATDHSGSSGEPRQIRSPRHHKYRADTSAICAVNAASSERLASPTNTVRSPFRKRFQLQSETRSLHRSMLESCCFCRSDAPLRNSSRSRHRRSRDARLTARSCARVRPRFGAGRHS